MEHRVDFSPRPEPDVDCSEEDQRKGLAVSLVQECVLICRDWKPSDFEITPISGGITNAIYVVNASAAKKLTESNPNVNTNSNGGLRNDSLASHSLPVLVKLFGHGSELFIDRTFEYAVLKQLGKRGFAPQLYLAKPFGRVEEYIPNSRSMSPSEMSTPNNVIRIAQTLARLHLVSFSSVKETPDHHQHPVVLWSNIFRWLQLAKELDDTRMEGPKSIVNIDVVVHRAERLRQLLSSTSSANGHVHEHKPVVQFLDEATLCHNDLLSGNILYLEDIDEVMFIDYEYAGYNYIGFDIANHFNEHCGFELEPNYEEAYPNEEATQKPFITEYLRERSTELRQDINMNTEWSSEVWRCVIQRLHLYAMASDLWWGAWALIQQHHSEIDFNYTQYARTRLERSFGFHAKHGGHLEIISP